MSGVAAKPAARRLPVQGRSQATVRRILDAAARLMEERPLDEITTNRIAEAAGLTIGALYRFFPDREAVIQAILLGFIERFRDLIATYLIEVKPASREELVDGLIDLYVDFMGREPGFQALWFGGYLNVKAVDTNSVATFDLALAIKAYLVGRLGYRDSEALLMRTAIVVEGGGHLLEFAFRQKQFQRDAVIAEVKRLVARYFFEERE
ncbi:MAG TPA: TetR/AcrR family transcriptional regulator [Aliidongia sp.]|nr:TetR/AcrR family transcriptional regulator [Aliidongia sp.]